MYPARHVKPAQASGASTPLNGYCNGQNGRIPHETMASSDKLKLHTMAQLPNGYRYGSHVKLAPAFASALKPIRAAAPVPAQYYYTSPYSRARPNRYYTQGWSITHCVVPTRREYVAEIGDVAGYGYNMWRMKVHYNYMDHCLTKEPLYYGYGPGYQSAPM